MGTLYGDYIVAHRSLDFDIGVSIGDGFLTWGKLMPSLGDPFKEIFC
jgi:hypothetical protein